MKAHIYLPAKTSMQSGRHKTKNWILEFKTSRLQYIEPLMKWTGTRETQSQVKLYFATCEEACQYARQHGLDYNVSEPQSPAFKPKSYSDNFRADRLR
ncbi:MAG: ETC complex I subunit [Janthinobacterium lividum]